MGNAGLGRQRPAVQERLTRPQRLVRQLSDLDSGRLRRLIRSGDLAPCFDADDDERAVECPICFYVLLSEPESIQVLRQRDLYGVLLATDAVQGFQSCPLPFLQNRNLRCRILQF